MDATARVGLLPGPELEDDDAERVGVDGEARGHCRGPATTTAAAAAVACVIVTVVKHLGRHVGRRAHPAGHRGAVGALGQPKVGDLDPPPPGLGVE